MALLIAGEQLHLPRATRLVRTETCRPNFRALVLLARFGAL